MPSAAAPMWSGAAPDDRVAAPSLLLQAALGRARARSRGQPRVRGGGARPPDMGPAARSGTRDVRPAVRRPTRRPAARPHRAPAPDDIVMVDGLAVTSVARTVVDIARRARFEAAVAVADAALAGRQADGVLVPRPDRRRTGGRASGPPTHRLSGPRSTPRCAGRRGGRASRPHDRFVAFADGRAESVGESRSRVAIARAGLPAPVLQLPVRLAAATAYADFGWPAQRTVGEFDGKVKYGRLLRPGQEPGDAVFAEKLREDAIPRAGLGSRALDLDRSARLHRSPPPGSAIASARTPAAQRNGARAHTQNLCARPRTGSRVRAATPRGRPAWRRPPPSRGSSARSRPGSARWARCGCRR